MQSEPWRINSGTTKRLIREDVSKGFKKSASKSVKHITYKIKTVSIEEKIKEFEPKKKKRL